MNTPRCPRIRLQRPSLSFQQQISLQLSQTFFPHIRTCEKHIAKRLDPPSFYFSRQSMEGEAYVLRIAAVDSYRSLFFYRQDRIYPPAPPDHCRRPSNSDREAACSVIISFKSPEYLHCPLRSAAGVFSPSAAETGFYIARRQPFFTAAAQKKLTYGHKKTKRRKQMFRHNCDRRIIFSLNFPGVYCI